MKNMFIERVVNRTLSTKPETTESMITPNLSTNFGLYNSKMTQFTNPTEENNEQHTNSYVEQPDSISSQNTEKFTHLKPSKIENSPEPSKIENSPEPSKIENSPEPSKIENSSETIIADNEQSTNFKEDDIQVVQEKKIPNFTSIKNHNEEKSQEKNSIVADELSNNASSVSSKKITKNTQIKSQKKESSLESSTVPNMEKHNSQIAQNKMNSKSKYFNTSFTNEKPNSINAVEQNSFVTNLKDISKKENIITKNIVQITENKINNATLDVTTQNEQKIKNSNVSQIESKKDNKKNIGVQDSSPILIEPSNKTFALTKNPSNLYVEKMKNNKTNVVTINIDRIEVRANLPQKEKNNNSISNTSKMSLSKYLQLRKEGVL